MDRSSLEDRWVDREIAMTENEIAQRSKRVDLFFASVVGLLGGIVGTLVTLLSVEAARQRGLIPPPAYLAASKSTTNEVVEVKDGVLRLKELRIGDGVEPDRAVFGIERNTEGKSAATLRFESPSGRTLSLGGIDSHMWLYSEDLKTGFLTIKPNEISMFQKGTSVNLSISPYAKLELRSRIGTNENSLRATADSDATLLEVQSENSEDRFSIDTFAKNTFGAMSVSAKQKGKPLKNIWAAADSTNGISIQLSEGDVNRAVLGNVGLVTQSTGTETKTSPASLTLFDKDGNVSWRTPER